MQQVGAEAFATATPVDARQLPGLVRERPARQAVINASHIWVLHRRRVLQGVAALLVCAGIAGLYEARAHLEAGAASGYQIAEDGLAKSGFAISRIEITGQILTSARAVLDALAIKPDISTLNFNVDAARAAIEKLPAVQAVTVRKIFPGRLVVKITEKVPVARWRIDGRTYLIDRAGTKIADADGGYDNLPLMVGVGAGDNAAVMIRAINLYPALKEGLVALSRIADRRWDMIYRTGLRVELPELGVAKALSELAGYQTNYQLLDRDVTLIDLRVPGLVSVLPTEEAQKQLKEIAKQAAARNSVHYKGDADYAAPPGSH